MNLWNVSMVIAPNLFMHKALPSKVPEGKEKQLAEGAANVVRMMIHYQDLLWTVSHLAVCLEGIDMGISQVGSKLGTIK